MAKRKKRPIHGAPFRPDLACPVQPAMAGTPAAHRKEAHHYLGEALTEVKRVELAKDCREAVGRALRVAHKIGMIDASVHQPHVDESEMRGEAMKIVDRTKAALERKGCVRPKRKGR